MLGNTGTTPQKPNFEDSDFVINPVGLIMPVSDMDGSLPDGVGSVFGDIDNDGDFDLFYGASFTNSFADKTLFFSENTNSFLNSNQKNQFKIQKFSFLMFLENWFKNGVTHKQRLPSGNV